MHAMMHHNRLPMASLNVFMAVVRVYDLRLGTVDSRPMQMQVASCEPSL